MSGTTELGRRIAARIRASGPITVADYMEACLADPTDGYYVTRDPLGVAGDFTTAPEISQMFGELIGLWAADSWTRLGSHAPCALVELGPGRGTLMADAMRAAKVVAPFAAALEVHLVETSPVLEARQRETLGSSGIVATWHRTLSSVPEDAAIFLANEFFDALPVRQFERASGGWRERLVGSASDGGLAIVLGDTVPPHPPAEILREPAPDGSIAEWSPAREGVIGEIAARLVDEPGAALIIDYGHSRPGFGDTVQAVAAHRPAGLFDRPGDADLTAHVDFTALARAARSAGADCHGPIEMGRFLRALGIVERAARLAAGKDASARAATDAALSRLTDPDAMGSLFKVLALASPGAPPPEPFSTGLIA